MSTYKLDFEALKQRVTFADAISYLHLDIKFDGAGKWRGECPACKTGDKRSLSITEGKGFTCWSSHPKAAGDVIALVSHIKGMAQFDSARCLSDYAGGNSTTVPDIRRNSSPAPEPRQVPKREFDPVAYFKELHIEHEEITALGLSKATCEHFQCGLRTNGVLAGRLAIRVDNAQGEFVAFIGRSLKGEDPLYKFPSGFDPGTVLFNVNRISGSEVRMVRDVLDVLTAREAGDDDVICFLTDLVEPAQHELLAGLQDAKHFKVFY